MHQITRCGEGWSRGKVAGLGDGVGLFVEAGSDAGDEMGEEREVSVVVWDEEEKDRPNRLPDVGNTGSGGNAPVVPRGGVSPEMFGWDGSMARTRM